MNIKKIKKNGSLPNYKLSNFMEKENIDLKLLVNRYKKMLNILFDFINELNDLNENPEIDNEQLYDISFLINHIAHSRNDIVKLIEQNKNDNDNDIINLKIKNKLNKIHKKMLNNK